MRSGLVVRLVVNACLIGAVAYGSREALVAILVFQAIGYELHAAAWRRFLAHALEAELRAVVLRPRAGAE
jgi:hypothetical protein